MSSPNMDTHSKTLRDSSGLAAKFRVGLVMAVLVVYGAAFFFQAAGSVMPVS